MTWRAVCGRRWTSTTGGERVADESGGSDALGGGRDDLLVVALARGDSYAAAGRAARVSEATVRRRMADEVFRRRVSRMRGELVDQACGQASAALTGAVSALVGLLASPNHAVRLGACKTLVGTVLQLREATELEERVVALEGIARGVETGAQLRRVQ